MVVVLAGTFLPLAQVSSATLPACCRRDGAHHCNMHPVSGDGFKSAQSLCPYRSLLFSTSPTPALLVTGASTVISVRLSGEVLSEPLVLSFRVVEGRQPRAPPIL